MCLTDDIDNDNVDNSCNYLHSPLLLPNDLEHEVPSLASSRESGWILLEDGEDQDSSESEDSVVVKSHVKMFLIFVGLVVFGAASSVSAKLQAIPMYNYPTFLNVFGNLLFVFACFLYIIPVSYFGWLNNAIPAELWALPKRPFMIMGSLDSLATTMQVFAAVYLPGPLMVLLMQTTIPISMVMSRLILGERYRFRQIVGALIVLVGIMVVLEPIITQRQAPKFVCEAIQIDDYCTVCQVETTQETCLSHRLDEAHQSTFLDWDWIRSNQTGWKSSVANSTLDDDDADEGNPVCKWIPSDTSSAEDDDAVLMVVWSFMIIASCFPTTVSSIYKQIIFSEHPSMDPIFLNGWVSLYQLFFSVCLVVPSGMATTPTVQPLEVPGHLWRGLKCFAGYGSVETGCHPDNLCSTQAALFVLFSIFCSVFGNLFMLLVLKYGSTALLYLGLTAMVPLANLAFALPFLPQQAQQPHFMQDVSDVLGLLVILGGLVLYRFGSSSSSCSPPDNIESAPSDVQSSSCIDQVSDIPTDGEGNADSSLREPLLSHQASSLLPRETVLSHEI